MAACYHLEFLRLCWAYALETDANAKGTHQSLISMLRIRINPDPYAQGTVRISSWPLCSACFEGTGLCARIITWCIYSVHAPVPNSYDQCTHQFLTRMISARISSWRVCSAYATAPDAHAQCTHQFLIQMLRVYKMKIWKIEKLMRILISYLRNTYLARRPTVDAKPGPLYSSLLQPCQHIILSAL